jgi:SAM-dependent methyltransferase
MHPAQTTATAPSAGAASYWRRLREPRHLVARDLALMSRIARTRPVLDVGCGNGAFVRSCRAAGIEAVGVEPSRSAIAVALGDGATVLRAAGEELPFANATFDVVRLKEVFEHVERPLDLATELRRVLRPNGVLVAYVPTQWSQLYPAVVNFWDDYTHVRPFSRIGLTRLLEDAGFAAVAVEGYTPPLEPWQRPLCAALSRGFPFLWRALARREVACA